MVLAADGVLIVASTRWPVSAAVRAISTVSELADHDDVGVLAQRGLEGGGERRGVATDLALRDHGGVLGVDDLDRVLDGEDVDRVGAVEEIDEGCERGGLAVAARAGDHDQALVVLGDLGERRR
jgi:hypothetical protein